VLQVGPRELEQLLEYLRRLLLVERPHGGGGGGSSGSGRGREDGGRRRRVTDFGDGDGRRVLRGVGFIWTYRLLAVGSDQTRQIQQLVPSLGLP
jgi:hypothetical protein